MSTLAPLRVAAILHWFVAVGFGVFCFPAIRNLLIGRSIPIVMGFPAYGRGPFERVGIPTTIPLLVGICLAHPACLRPRLDYFDSSRLADPPMTLICRKRGRVYKFGKARGGSGYE